MARLAAYYQEDFHYPSVGQGHKQRKSSYVVYEEPKNNLFNGHVYNSDRIRGLAASEPHLDHLPRTEKATLKQRPQVYGSQMIENPNLPMHYFENFGNAPIQSNRYGTFEAPEVFDNESVYSFCEVPLQDNRYRHRGRSRKRFSYAEPTNNGYHSPEMTYMPQSIDRHHPMQDIDFRNYNNRMVNIDRHHHPKSSLEDSDFRNYNNSLVHPDNYCVETSGNNLSPPMFFRPESRQGKWQQYPWIPASNPMFLSPPSPLDSGLSSQSITSSPSLDAEPGFGHFPRSKQQCACSCNKVTYCETPQLNTGRTSPGVYSVSHHSNGLLPRRKGRTSKGQKAADDFDIIAQQYSQVRYGKLGLIGEPTDNEETHISGDHDDFHKHERVPKERVHYVYTDENGIPLRKTHHRPKSHNSHSNYTRPCVIIIDGPEKGGGSECASSPEQEISDKSQGPESPMSVTVSNSNSPSVTSSSNDLDIDERRKSDKTTELEIRELEDMYEKCNLGDRDLLDRAERRDLPTAHQTRRDQITHRLTRSNSDTLYEMASPFLRNPYEKPQRAPPSRRSGLPDRIADDMALRKLRRPSSRSGFNPADNTITYMLCSSHFTPTVPAGRDILLLDNPDVELDDLSYRKHYFGKKSKIADPQPPFGIPLRPPPTQRVYSDYLHVVPSKVPQPLCHPRGNPDVVRDDMAFRTLRKDEPERMYYDVAQVYKKKG